VRQISAGLACCDIAPLDASGLLRKRLVPVGTRIAAMRLPLS
jgi:hypothetical protein